ncbi:MAG TPA: nuclear transport factor 2 family protein [Nitrososphaeraceae archaeon]|nr:nuclear transport factor 2 family protein [Nitrososphaeraceae archaeon]
MTTRNDNLLKELIETENSHDVEKVLTFLTEDIVFEDVTFGVVMRGKDGFKEIYPTFITAAPDFKLEPKAGY